MKRSLTIIFLLFFLLAGCAPAASVTAPAFTPTPRTVAYLDSSRDVEARVADLLGRMTLEEKIGQMTQVATDIILPGDVNRYYLGSILSGGSGIPLENSLSGWIDMVDGFQAEALTTRLAIPILYGIDAVHGLGHLKGATIFPQNIGLGAANDIELMRSIGRATAEEMLAAGINWNFAPVIAVPQDIRWGRTYEAYGEETGLVSALGAAYIEGLQSVPEMTAAAPGQTLGVLATAKHYLGDGGTLWGSPNQVNQGVRYMLDQGNMQANEETLRALYLPPYQAAVDAGAMSVMVSFSSWNGTKMHAHRYLITSVLKGELGFQGFVVSDWAGINQIQPDNYYESVVTAINAGIDMAMIPDSYTNFISSIDQAVKNEDITLERIDDAVTRILRVKFLLGLFDHPYADPVFRSAVRSSDHLALAEQAVRESLVLLKNDSGALPVDPNASTILVAGVAADNTGMQSGGWTLGWQGINTNDVVGSTILDGIRIRAGGGTEILYRSAGMFTDLAGKAPVGIVVVGETSYAEGVGDKADLRLTQDDIDIIERMRPKVETLIVVIISGRPLVIYDQYPVADAWVAAWLPGSEGAAVADVLFGGYPFTGRTPYSWPRSNAQLPINVNNSAGLTGCQAPLFPFGYGLGEAASLPVEWFTCEAARE
ncbi:MAG: glycoside hydrolase family 3 protein [Anaerolineales bacterium]|nr:glycoside hydrolase family 3 protein [Anaerolineales bacterium]